LEEYNELILEELRGIKSEFINIRTEISSVRKDMLDNATSCGLKHTELSNTFVHGITFWKVISIVLCLVSGSYAYTAFIYQFLLH